MKFLFFVTALLITSTTFADTTLSRNNDGMTARCSEKADVGRRSYSLTLLSEKITIQDAQETRDVALEAKFTKCAEVGNGFKLVDSSSDEILHSYIILNDGNLGTTDNKLVAVNFYAVDEKGVTHSTLSLGKAPGTFRIYMSFKANVKKAYVLAELTSDVTSPVGSILGLVQRYGGFVLSFEN